MDIILIVLHVVLSLGIITLVLLQKGAGASAGAAFGGGGGGGSVFGATGASNFLSKTTAIFATLFFLNSMALAYLAANRDIQAGSVLDGAAVPAVETQVETSGDVPAPALDVPAAAGDIPAPEVDVPAVEDVPVPAE